MKESRVGAWPWGARLVWLASIVLSMAAALSSVVSAAGVDVYTVVFLVLAPIYATVGAIILSRASGNHVGWVLLLIGLLLSIEDFSGAGGTYAATAAGRWVPGEAWMNWMSNWVWVPAVVGALALLPMLFPNGRLPSRRWAPLAWIVWGATAVSLGGYVFIPSGINTAPGYVNPVGLAALIPLSGLLHALYVLALLVGVLGGAGSLLVRYRHGNSEERQQIKWFAWAFVLLAAMLAMYAASQAVGIASPAWLIAVILCIGLTAVPLTVAVAVLRYRLYDIDIIISRTLVYGSLAAFITAVYVGIAVGIGSLVGGGGKPNLGLSILATAIVAVGFQPVRERLHRIANRLVYGKRATPYEVLSQFSERVAESYASEDVLPRMARVLGEGTNADLAEVWLRRDGLLQRVAAFPRDDATPAAVHVNGTATLAIPGADRSVVVRHQGELLGALTVTKRRGEAITPIEVKLMEDLAHQAGLVLKNVGLTADLQNRLVDLRASRQRLVAAQDDERRRLERNLHDGAQQHLVALKIKLGLVEMLATRDPERARATVAELKHDADEALETLRDLARGIYPPLLAEKGLPTALQAHSRKATLPVTIEADGVGRYPQDTEAALYFCILEALQNIQKYAQATAAVVRLREDGDHLTVEVVDDGRGFDIATTIRGNGLTNMEDRLDALGGTLRIISSPGAGTTVRAAVPVPHTVPITV
jgi:signal transduction histidine kinase